MTSEQYYGDDMYLSNSALSRFCSFDYLGNVTYNIHQFLNPPKLDSTAILIGSIVDKILTEQYNMDEDYWPTLDKAGMMDQLDLMWVEYKKADTNPTLRSLLANNWYVFKKEMANGVRESIESLVDTALHFQYDKDTTFMEFIKECDSQFMIVNDEWGMKGKFDFINHKRWLISDLKTTGNIDMLTRDMFYKGQIQVHHKYVRQLAIYQQLYFLETWKKYMAELIIIDYKGNHNVIRIGQRALDKALEQVMRDIEVLSQVYSGERPYIETYDIPEPIGADDEFFPITESDTEPPYTTDPSELEPDFLSDDE